MTFAFLIQHSTELWLALGVLGSALEAIGEAKKWPTWIALGQRLESLSLDLPKLWRGSRATAAASAAKLKEAADRDDDDQNPPTAPTGRRLSSVAPKGGQDTTEGTLPRIVAASMVAIGLLLCPGLFGCSGTQTPQAQAAQARQYGRLAYSAGVLGVKTLEDVRIAWMKGTGEAPTAAQVKIADDVSTGLHAAHDALEKVRPWVEGGSGGSPEKERLLEALDSVALVAQLLGGAGAKVPPDVMQGIAAARSLLGGA